MYQQSASVAELRRVRDKQFPGSINQVSVKNKAELAKWQRVCNVLIMLRVQLHCVTALPPGTVTLREMNVTELHHNHGYSQFVQVNITQFQRIYNEPT